MNIIYILIFMQVAFNIAYGESEFLENEKQESDKKGDSGSAKPSLDFNEVKKTFRLAKDEITSFETAFDTSSLELIWPATWEDSIKSGVFLANAKSKENTNRQVLIKFQKKSTIKAWYNEKEKTTECSYNEKIKQIPMEYMVGKEFSGKSRIPQFYAENSNYKGARLVYLVSHYFKNGLTLNEWFKNQTSDKTVDKKELEKNLKIFFKQMHEALLSLKRKNYLYTDFKPENVLVNLNNKKGSVFLMNMGNVVAVKDNKINQICMASKEYFPPSNDQVDIDSKTMIRNYLSSSSTKVNKVDNLLIWTYCSSLMSLVCNEFDKRKDSYFKNRKIYAAMKGSSSSLAKLMKCQDNTLFKSSTKLYSFLDACLAKESKITKFEEIINQEWFKE